MKVTFATIILCAWFVMLATALIGAVMACARNGAKAILCALQLLFGNLLAFGFVSGVIGLYEINDYAQTLRLWVSLVTGTGGLALFIHGIQRLR